MKTGAIKQVGALLKLGRGHQNREWVQYPCPFARWKHASGKDTHPSFGIRIRPNKPSHFWCFTCHKSGPLSYLPLAIAHYTGRHDEAHERMLAVLKIEADEGFGEFEDGMVEDEVIEPLDERQYGNIFPHVWEDREALRYISDRGVRRAGAEALDMRYDPEEKRIIFPVRDEKGQLFGFTGRTILPQSEWPDTYYRKSKDYAGLPKKHMLLNAQNVTPDCKVVPVEGPMDVAVAATALHGTEYVPVGLLGSALLQPKFEMLVGWGRPVLLFLDNDKAGSDGIMGTEGRPGAADQLAAEMPVFIVPYPDRKPYNHWQPDAPVDGGLDPGKMSHEEILHAVKHSERW